ncbi:HD domain-containing protein [Isobaculum melis]|uniref:HD/PDEase domain-containing protein n=1 Tax=Isobaculum melis TaxID=142588 RepID=A0A1H9QEZ0_9LACT|nr:HD domain-containing protein [Isobaculum melis]SER59002.1 uncharacterized protein SAMN04488559_10237 [Isobaculum melis]
MSHQEEIIQQTEQYVRHFFKDEGTGHGFDHTQRVWLNAQKLQKIEGGDAFLIEMAALLHDVADEKLVADPAQVTLDLHEWLQSINVSQTAIKEIQQIIDSVGFKGGNGRKPKTLEAKIVQDADRLDAIGAIGIARTLLYSGATGQALYDETILIREAMTNEAYRNMPSTCINHFYEKLLKIKELMQTKAAQAEAQQRHERMLSFLEAFYEETGYQKPGIAYD